MMALHWFLFFLGVGPYTPALVVLLPLIFAAVAKLTKD